MSVHVIPVPASMTPEESWEEIRLLGCLLTEHAEEECTWAVVEVEDEEAA